MKKAIITINLYSLEELSESAKSRAIDEHRQFLLSTMSPSDFISGDEKYDTPEELHKMYDSEYDYYLNNDEPIIESIDANEYLFYESGDLAHTVHYCKGIKEGKEFYIKDGIEYELS